jgi:hypothetical protein
MRGKSINYGICERLKTELPALLPTVDFGWKRPLNAGHSAKIPPILVSYFVSSFGSSPGVLRFDRAFTTSSH